MKDITIEHKICEVTYEQISSFYLHENDLELLAAQIAKVVDFRVMCQIIDGRIKLDSKQRKSVKDYLYKIMIKN